MTPDHEDIARLRAALTRIARSVDRQTLDDGHTLTQHMVLATLTRTGPIGVGELAEIEGLNPTMLSRVVGKLETAGLVRRRADEADGRVVRVEITAAGRRLQLRRRDQRSRVFAEHLAELPTDVVASVFAALPALEDLAEHLAAPRREAVQSR